MESARGFLLSIGSHFLHFLLDATCAHTEFLRWNAFLCEQRERREGEGQQKRTGQVLMEGGKF